MSLNKDSFQSLPKIQQNYLNEQESPEERIQDKYMIGNLVLRPQNEYRPINKSKSQIDGLTRNSEIKSKQKILEDQSLKLLSQPDPLNWQSRQYINHMKDKLFMNLRNDKFLKQNNSKEGTQTLSSMEEQDALYEILDIKIKVTDDDTQGKEFLEIKEQTKQKRKVIADFQNHMKASNKRTAQVNPTQSIFEKMEKKIGENPSFLFKQKDVFKNNQNSQNNVQDEQISKLYKGMFNDINESRTHLQNAYNDFQEDFQSRMQREKLENNNQNKKQSRNKNESTLQKQRTGQTDKLIETDIRKIEIEKRSKSTIQKSAFKTINENKVNHQDLWMQDLKEKDLHLGMDTKQLYHRLKKKEELCKFKLQKAVKASNLNVIQISQGKSLQNTIEKSNSKSNTIIPNVEFYKETNKNGELKERAKLTEISSIPIFKNPQIMQTVNLHLDLACLKSQIIQNAPNSQYNQLLKFKNGLYQKKRNDLIQKIRQNISEIIRSKLISESQKQKLFQEQQLILENIYNKIINISHDEIDEQQQAQNTSFLEEINNKVKNIFLTIVEQSKINDEKKVVLNTITQQSQQSQSVKDTDQKRVRLNLQLQNKNKNLQEFKIITKDIETLNFGANPSLKQQNKLQAQNTSNSSPQSLNKMKSICSQNNFKINELSQFLDANKIPINYEQKLQYIIEEQIQKSQSYQQSIDKTIGGYVERDLEQSLIQYLYQLNISKMNKQEIDLIMSNVFDKNDLTRIIKKQLQIFQEKKQEQFKEEHNQNGYLPENQKDQLNLSINKKSKKNDDENKKIPNLFKLAKIFDPMKHINQDEILEMFQIYLNVKQQQISRQQKAFQNLKNVLFKMEQFDNKIFDGNLNKGQNPVKQPILQKKLSKLSRKTTFSSKKHIEKSFKSDDSSSKSSIDSFTNKKKGKLFFQENSEEQSHEEIQNFIEKEEQSHQEIIKFLNKRAKAQIVDEFEQELNRQHNNEVNIEMEKVFQNKKDKEKKTQRSLINEQSRKLLLELDFDPGDNLLIDTYIYQMKFFTFMKKKYEKKKKIHDFINEQFTKQAQNIEIDLEEPKKKVKKSQIDDGINEREKELFVQFGAQMAKKQQMKEPDIKNFNYLIELKLKSYYEKEKQTIRSLEKIENQFSDRKGSPEIQFTKSPTIKKSQSPNKQKKESGSKLKNTNTQKNDRVKHLIEYIQTKNQLYKGMDELSANTLRILERMDLDRKILFKEKITFLLQETDNDHKKKNLQTQKSNYQQKKNSIELMKQYRKNLNQHQIEVYNNLIKIIQQRYSDQDQNQQMPQRKSSIDNQDQYNTIETDQMKQNQHETKNENNKFIALSKEEIRFINLIKIILEAGWCFDSKSYYETLQITGMYDQLQFFQKEIQKYEESISQIQNQAHQYKIKYLNSLAKRKIQNNKKDEELENDKNKELKRQKLQYQMTFLHKKSVQNEIEDTNEDNLMFLDIQNLIKEYNLKNFIDISDEQKQKIQIAKNSQELSYYFAKKCKFI